MTHPPLAPASRKVAPVQAIVTFVAARTTWWTYAPHCTRASPKTRLKEAADIQDLPLKPLVYIIMQGIAEDPEFAGADTDEKNRVVVMFGERMYRNHIQAQARRSATPSDGCPRSCRA
jgi:hypothetical protein